MNSQAGGNAGVSARHPVRLAHFSNNDVPLGVVGVDEKENIRVLNLVAWSLLRNNRLYALGRSVKEVHPENGFSQVRGAKERSIDQVKILVGGAPVTAEYAEKIGADVYGQDAMETVEYCKAQTDTSA